MITNINALFAPGKATVLPKESRKSLTDKKARPYIFADPQFYQWGGSVILDDEGTYHMYYARWPKANPRGMYGWLYVSEIAHATAKRPEGPYKYKDVVLKGFGEPQAERWDAYNAHNPCITRMRDNKSGKLRYYLYYIANRDDNSLHCDWWNRIINQRVGVAVADSPNGPWTRHLEPVITPPNGQLHHYLVNPGVCQLPDGRSLMVLKGRGKGLNKKDERGVLDVGPMLHGWALADCPEGPFKVQKSLLFPGHISAEDPCVWVAGGKIYAAVKDWHGKLGGIAGISYVIGTMDSDNTITWEIPKEASISERIIKWDDGKETRLNALERPFVLIGKDNHPTHLFAAASVLNPFGFSSMKADTLDDIDVESRTPHLPFNLCIPLKKEKNA